MVVMRRRGWGVQWTVVSDARLLSLSRRREPRLSSRWIDPTVENKGKNHPAERKREAA